MHNVFVFICVSVVSFSQFYCVQHIFCISFTAIFILRNQFSVGFFFILSALLAKATLLFGGNAILNWCTCKCSYWDYRVNARSIAFNYTYIGCSTERLFWTKKIVRVYNPCWTKAGTTLWKNTIFKRLIRDNMCI